MSQWHEVADENELPNGAWKEVHIDTLAILVIHQDNQYYAMQNICTHDGASLSGGAMDDGEMICPRHGARFCIKTGEALCPPAYEPVDTYPTRVVNGKVQVHID